MKDNIEPIHDLHHTKSMDINFENIRMKVKQGKGIKEIIKGVSGTFKSGELTAIMGPSGAGKTTLLNILTGCQKTGTTGTIKCNNINNTKCEKSQYKKEACYILQDDHLAPFFTVSEIMNIAADLKLGNLTREKKNMLIDDVLNTLKLLQTKETRCQSLSGGQQKRVSIALELLDNPPIMFLDEPTTGLDSLSSTQCIAMLKDLAREGRTIVCTIHQPSATLYEMFDHIYVMAQGQCIYKGSSLNTVSYLAANGFNCPQYHNPADYLIEVANCDHGNFTTELAKSAEDTTWRNIVTIPKLENEIKRDIIEVDNNENIYNNPMTYIQSPSELSKFFTLLYRSALHIYRDWTVSQLRLILHILVGIFLGVFYQRAGSDGSKTINNLGFFLVSTVYLNYTSMMPAVLKFPSEIAVLKKERFNNWYNLRTYYIAFLVADIPIQVIFSVAYCVTSYLISVQPYEWYRYFMVQLILALVTLTASSMGLVLGTVVNPINGTFLGAILSALMLSVAGFLIIFTHMPKFLYFLTYTSYLSFAMEALAQAVYGYNRVPLPCPEEADYCHYRFPQQILLEFGMEKENYWIDVCYLVVSFFALRVLAYCTLKRKLSPK